MKSSATVRARHAYVAPFLSAFAACKIQHCLRLQTAERTRELAANTLGELESQGQKLDRIDADLHEV